MKISKLNPLFLLILLITLMLGFGYHDVFFNNKLLFPSNHMAHFYSPWSTHQFPGWGHSIPTKPIGTDPIRFFYPNWEYAIKEVKNGKIPFWNPYIFSGNVLLANFQSAFFYVPNWVYFLIPQYQAWMLLHFVPYFVAGIGTYFFGKKIGMNTMGAIFSAIGFAFSGYMITWSQENTVVPHTAAFLPLLLFIIENYTLTRKKQYLLIFSIVWATSFLAGHLQTNFYITLFAIFYFVSRLPQPKNYNVKEIVKSSLPFILSLVLGIGLTGVQLLPSLEAFSLSPRPSVNSFSEIQGYLLPLHHVFRLIVPDWQGNPGSYNYFGEGFYHETAFTFGIAGIVFAIFTMVNKRNSYTTFFTVAAFVTFFFTNDNVITRFILSQNIPLLSTFLPSRILLLTTFALAILSGLGMTIYMKKNHTDHLKILQTIIFSIFGITMFFFVVHLLNISVMKVLTLQAEERTLTLMPSILKAEYLEKGILITVKNSLIPISMLAVLFFVGCYLKRYLAYIALAMTIISQLWLLNKYFMPGEKIFFYPEHFVFTTLQKNMQPTDRFITFGNKIHSNVFLRWEIASPEGLDPMYNYRYGQLLHAALPNTQFTTNIPRVEAKMPDIRHDSGVNANIRLYNLMSLLGTKYVAYYDDPNQRSLITPAEKFPEDEFKLLETKEHWYIYEFRDAMPRAFLVDNYMVKTSMPQITNTLFDKEATFKKYAILEEDLPITLTPQIPTDTVTIDAYDSQEVIIRTNVAGPKLLVVTDNYYPGWKAFTDDKETPIYRANGSFRAIIIPEGAHNIKFTYQPTIFFYGILLSTASSILLLAFVFGNKIRGSFIH